MSEINVASKLSFGEIAKRTTAGGELVEIFEAMNEVNPVFKYIPAVQCNQHMSHMVSRRTSVPSGTWRKYYKGSATKASTTQVQYFPVSLLEALSEVDEDLIDNAEDPKGVRRQEDMAFVEGMQQQVMDAIIYGTTSGYPERIDGLTSYLTTLSQTMVVDGGNAGGTSIYVVDFSPRTCFMIYPRAAKNRTSLGLSINTNPTGGNGKKWATDSDSLDYLVYCTQFKWWVGFVVRDLLAIGRYANINATVGGSNTFDENKLIELLEYGRFNPQTTYMLCTKEIKAQARIRAKDKANIHWDVTTGLTGEEIVRLGPTPLLRCDSIATNESTVA